MTTPDSGIPASVDLGMLARDIANWIYPAPGYEALHLSSVEIHRALPSFLRDALATTDTCGCAAEHGGRSVDPYGHLKPGDADPFPETGDECGAAFFDQHGDEQICTRPAHPGHWQHIACYDKVTATSTHIAEPDPFGHARVGDVFPDFCAGGVNPPPKCGASVGPDRYYCNRSQHAVSWAHIATDYNGRVLAVGEDRS